MTRNVPWGQQQLWKTQHLQLIFYDLIPQNPHFKETCSLQSFGLSVVLQLLLSFLYFLPSSSLFLASFSFPSFTFSFCPLSSIAFPPRVGFICSKTEGIKFIFY